MAVAAGDKGCWWLLRLPGEGGCWLRLARRVVAGPREVLHVAGYNGQGQQQGASIKEGGEVAGRCWQGEGGTAVLPCPQHPTCRLASG